MEENMRLVEMTEEEKDEFILIELKNVVMLKADVPTKNGHVYPKEILEDIAASFTKFEAFDTTHYIYSNIKNSSQDFDFPDMTKICGCIDSLRVETRLLEDGTEECALVGDIKIFNTPEGNLINYVNQLCYKNGTNIYFVPFGRGTTNVMFGRCRNTFTIVSYELMGFKASLFAPQ
jgi:hypothetical protein